MRTKTVMTAALVGVIGAVNCDGSQQRGYFWSRALGWPLVWDQDQETAIQSPSGGPKVTWSGPPLMPRPRRDRLRLDVAVRGPAALDTAVAALVDLGATRTDATGAHGVVVMLDPDQNEFRVLSDGTTQPA